MKTNKTQSSNSIWRSRKPIMSKDTEQENPNALPSQLQIKNDHKNQSSDTNWRFRDPSMSKDTERENANALHHSSKSKNQDNGS